MTHPSQPDPQPESPPARGTMTATGGKNVTQVGGNMTATTTTHYNFVFFVIGLLALGGLAWGLNVVFGSNEGGNPSQPQVQPAAPAAEPPSASSP